MKKRIPAWAAFAAVVWATLVGIYGPDVVAQDPTGPVPPSTQVTNVGAFKMNQDATSVWFTPPQEFVPYPLTEYDVMVTFCRAEVDKTIPDPQGGPDKTITLEYQKVPDAEGKTLATTMFQGRLVPYPWVAATKTPDGGVPRTNFERTFLHLVLKNLEAANDQVTDADWADPKKRLGVTIAVSGYVEHATGAEVYRMVDTYLHLFPRKGVTKIVVEDDVTTMTIVGTDGLTWPRGQ